MVKDILKIKFNMTSTCILFGIHRQCMLYQFDILYQIRLLQIVARAFRPSKVLWKYTEESLDMVDCRSQTTKSTMLTRLCYGIEIYSNCNFTRPEYYNKILFATAQ